LFRLDVGTIPGSFLLEWTFTVRGRAEWDAGAIFYLSPDVPVDATESVRE
jgi:hypothetical protein